MSSGSSLSQFNLGVQGGTQGEGFLQGWRGWFVTGPLHPSLRVRQRSKSVDFHGAEHRQQPCRIIIGNEMKQITYSVLEMNNTLIPGAYSWGGHNVDCDRPLDCQENLG
ncbi:hypothetical protein TNCV_1964991 [Trichonephila clavipes]|nr:hypothetical protein TNCV_1964991 [Trichonephila clavipes]